MHALSLIAAGSLGLLLCCTQEASGQETFAGGDAVSAVPETFNGADAGHGGPEDFGDRERFRPLPGYTNCGPWYNNYSNFVRAMMQHYGGLCEVRNGNQVWCHARIAGTCNADASGGRPDSPMLDTGVRYTTQCQSVCDRRVGGPGPEPVFSAAQLRRGGPPDCVDSPDSQQRISIRKTGIAALDTLAAGGSQVDHMLDAFGQALATDAAQLLDPKKFLTTQVANAKLLVSMYSLPNDQFLGNLREGAVTLLAAAQRDPSGTLGSVAAVTVLRGTVARGPGVVCNASVKAAAPALERLKASLENLQQLRKIRDAAPRVALGSINCPPINPKGRKEYCFYRAVAVDQRKDNPSGPVTAEDFAFVQGLDAPAPPGYAWLLLKTLYGKRRFSTLTPVQNAAQELGYPIEMTFEEAVDNLRRAGPGARGLLTMLPAGERVAHVTNVANEGGAFSVLDLESTQSPQALSYLTRNLAINDRIQSKFWLYRTAGPDMQP